MIRVAKRSLQDFNAVINRLIQGRIMHPDANKTPRPGMEVNAQGETVGRDPRNMTSEELTALGHVKAPLSKIIREKCIDCSHTESEVRKCTAIKCVLWPYRMRKNPFSEREMSEAGIKALADYRERKRTGKTDV